MCDPNHFNFLKSNISISPKKKKKRKEKKKSGVSPFDIPNI